MKKTANGSVFLNVKNNQYIINTKRLQLRLISMSDIDNLMKIFSDPIAMQYYPNVKTRQEGIIWIEHIIDTQNKYNLSMMVCELKNSNIFIGQCGFWIQEVSGNKEVEIGYLLIRNYWNNGYATEASIGCKQYAFNNEVDSVISLIRPENKASIRVAEKNGMEYSEEIDKSGYLHRVYRINND